MPGRGSIHPGVSSPGGLVLGLRCSLQSLATPLPLIAPQAGQNHSVRLEIPEKKKK